MAADNASFDTGNVDIGPGASSSPITMHTASAFPYHCTIHATMTGTLVVGQ